MRMIAAMAARVLLIHGSAADHTTWSIQLASPVAQRYQLDAYDRELHATVEEHARDDAARIPERALLVGSSFGAVIALDVARTYPDKCLGMVLIEPPMAA